MEFLRRLFNHSANNTKRPLYEIRGVMPLEADGLPAQVAMSRNGKYVLAAAKNGKLKCWDAVECRALVKQKFDGIEVECLAMDNAGRWALVGGTNPMFQGVVGLADLQDRQIRLAVMNKIILAIDVSPDGAQFATGSMDWIAKIFDLETLDAYLGVRHYDMVSAVRFTPDGKELVSASWDWTVKTTDIASMALIKSFECEPNHYTVKLSPDGAWLAVQLKTQFLLVETQSGLMMADCSMDGTLLGVNTHPSYGELVWLAQEEKLCAYSLRQECLLLSLPQQNSKIVSFTSSLDGRVFAAGEVDGSVCLFDLP
jgi:WD40 repeat protein